MAREVDIASYTMSGADTGFQERGVKAREARAQIFGHAHKVINHAPNCRDREAVSCFLTVKCTISTKFGTFEVRLLCMMLQ